MLHRRWIISVEWVTTTADELRIRSISTCCDFMRNSASPTLVTSSTR